MLSRRHRFHRRNALKAVYQRGKTFRAPMMTIKYYRKSEEGSYRLAVVVSKKVHKSAVTRNRIRRRVYEAVRRSDSNPPAGLDMIITVFSDQVGEIDHAKLQKYIDELLEKATKS